MNPRLPKPVGRQKEVLCLPPVGHAVILGTAGSGKTTLAIHRALYLAHPDTDHQGRTLLVTFNRCLVSYLRSLAGAVPRGVVVENYHRFARGYLNHRGKMGWNSICKPDLQKKLCEQAVAEATARGTTPPVLSRPTDLLVEEFRWLAQHGINTEEEYVAAERVGRAGARIVRADRPIVFGVYQRYLELRKAHGKDYDWEDLSHTVLSEFGADNGERKYRHVVIDEGQDFSPMMLRSLAAAIPQDGSLSFFGDMAQQIYGNRMSWRSAGLDVKRGVWEFEENYRNTQQVAQLALAIAAMPHFPDDADLVEPKSPTAAGPLPALVSFGTEAKEGGFAARQAELRGQTGTVAVLFRDREQEAAFARQLSQPATRLHRKLPSWPVAPTGIFHGTYHSAKGLEFDTVILPHLSGARLPHPPDVAAFGQQDAAARDSQLLYVAVTRARSTLILTHSGTPTGLLPTRADLYQRSSR
ncbi:MAG: UvrD-helicase domain-containing protein [bacterium]|nr:UvrD-helicase domain-containing protein [bacterium]